jgi:Flp pilus assembly protein TadG
MVLPLLLLLMLNAMNFSTYIYAWITVSNAARDAAEYQVYNGIPINAPGGPPSYSQVQSVVTADLSTLTNNSSQWTLEICSSSPPNGSTSCSGTGTYTPPADPEPGTYRLYSVDLAYQYSPIFSAFAVPLLGVNLTIPPATIHQQAVMRWMQ